MRTELCNPKTILFPVDLSEHSASAGVLVSALARRFESRVVVLFALEPVEYPIELLGSEIFETRSRTDAARAHLIKFLDQHDMDIPHELRVEEGKPASVIVHVAEEINADLLCMATRGRGPFRKFLLGSTTAKVLNDAPVPVLTGTHMDNPGGRPVAELRSIVCALGLDDRGRTALEAAALLAGVFNARLTVVHAREKTSPSTCEQIDEITRSLGRQLPGTPDIVISDGDVAQLIHEVSKERQADLVVIGRSAPGPVGRLRTQSYAIVRSAPCPVLSV